MHWAEKRIQQYREGQKATWLEKLALEHASPMNCAAHTIAFIVIAYGLWTHGWTWIIAAAVIALVGHLYSWLKQ